MTNSDYGWISMDTWLFFHGIYGGGPAHNICSSVICTASDDTRAGDSSIDKDNGDCESVDKTHPDGDTDTVTE